MKRAAMGHMGRYAAVVLLLLIGAAAILIVLRASVIAGDAINNAKRSDDVDYQLRLLKEKQTQPAHTTDTY